MKYLIGVLGLVLLTANVSAQSKVNQEEEQAWFGYFNQTRLSNSSGLWADLHYRLTDHLLDAEAYPLPGRDICITSMITSRSLPRTLMRIEIQWEARMFPNIDHGNKLSGLKRSRTSNSCSGYAKRNGFEGRGRSGRIDE